MITTISSELLKWTEDTLADKQGDMNPFVREGETTFIRHDEIRISQQREGFFLVEFCWRGMLTATTGVYCDFANGVTLTVAGIEGRMHLEVH